jgi:hypothetical protein
VLDILLWITIGLGVFIVGGKGISLAQDRGRSIGRHSSDEDRVKPEDLAKEWQGLRWTAFTVTIVPLIALSDPLKASDPLREPTRVIAAVATVVLLLWEIRSWRVITDPADRRRALNSARRYFAPALVQLLWLLHIWEHGMESGLLLTAMVLVMAGPEAESWVRRRLVQRAGGTTSTT